MIGKFNSETQTDNGNIWTLTYIFDSSLVPCISRGILKRYPLPPPQKKIYYIKSLNIYLENDLNKTSNQYSQYNVFSRNCFNWENKNIQGNKWTG